MFLLELKRGVSRISFWAVFLITSIITIMCAFQKSSYTSNSDVLDVYIKAPISSASDMFMIFNSITLSNLLILLMPLLACLCFADTYFDDINNGFVKFIYTRKDKIIYLRAKYFANFIVSGLAISIPITLNYIVLLLRYPSIKPNKILGLTTIKSTQLFQDLYYSHPNIYIALWICIFFLYSGIFGSIGLTLSIFIKNKIAILFLPFIICNVLGIILEIVGGYKYYPIGFLGISVTKSFSIISGEFLVLLLITLIIFLYGGKKHETY